MVNRAPDWLADAEWDVAQADESRQAGRHNWACFAAQQSAEKAVKALHYSIGQEAVGHRIVTLLEELPFEVPAELVEQARELDTFYIPTRYANTHAEGPAHEQYGPHQSEEAVGHARTTIEFVRSQMA